MDNLTWFTNGLSYIASSALEVATGNTLTVRPGVTVRMQGGSSLTVLGTLDAQGTAADQITFTSFADCQTIPCPGSWKSLAFVSPSTNSVLRYVVAEHGGSAAGDSSGNIFINGVSMQIENITSKHATDAALHIKNSSSSIKNSSFTNSEFGIKLYGAAYPQLLEGLSFANNTVKDIFIDNTAQCDSILGGYKNPPQHTNCP